MKMSLAMQLLGYPAEFVQDEENREQSLEKKEAVDATAVSGQMEHKPECSGYYAVAECECQSANWKPLSSGNYPRNPNPPMMERDPRCRD